MTDAYRERKIVRFNENLHAVKLNANGERTDDLPSTSDGTKLAPSPSSKNQMPLAASSALLPQQSEMLKRELLAKQLGRSPQSISGPELDAFQFISWKELPPCPIHGMQLTDGGLYDSDVGRFLDVDEVRDLINRAGKLEAVTNQTSESRLLGTTMQRIFELGFDFSRYCVVGMVGFFWGIKTPQAYLQAYPRKSLFVTQYHVKRRTNEEIELLCQKNRALYNATNPRVMFLFACGLTGVAIGVAGEYIRRMPSDYRDVSREAIRHNHHFEASMKWLFSVYYHHPAYTEAANSKRSRNIIASIPGAPPKRGPTPNLDSRRTPWEDKFPNR